MIDRRSYTYNLEAVVKLTPEKNSSWTGFEPMTSAIPVQYSQYRLSYQAIWEDANVWKIIYPSTSTGILTQKVTS